MKQTLCKRGAPYKSLPEGQIWRLANFSAPAFGFSRSLHFMSHYGSSWSVGSTFRKTVGAYRQVTYPYFLTRRVSGFVYCRSRYRSNQSFAAVGRSPTISGKSASSHSSSRRKSVRGSGWLSLSGCTKSPCYFCYK